MIGQKLKVKPFGSSHGKEVGVVIASCPKGVKISQREIQKELDRRKPGQSKFTTARKEADKIEIQSGIVNGITNGKLIRMSVKNVDVKSFSYKNIRTKPRPGHADLASYYKYGKRGNI